MQSYDVAIIGAGPGGSNAAAVMLRHGLRVVQFDRQKFPRLKPCGGGMTIKSTRSVQRALAPSVLATWRAVEFNDWNVKTTRFISKSPILSMVHRPDFDNSLVEQNKGSEGFTFFDEERVDHVDYEGRFRIQTDKQVIIASQLIGADGAYSLVNKAFKVSEPKDMAFAIEVNLMRPHIEAQQELVPCFDFGAIDCGYGWVFPKGDIVNVGLYSFARGISGVRNRLIDYIRDKGITYTDEMPKFEAHQIPVGGYRLKVPEVPVYIVGDAGGFADALTGEGIYHALESGRLAGETVVESLKGNASPATYHRRLWRSVLSDTMITYHLSRVFYRHISKSMRILENPLVWRPLIQGYANGATFTKSIIAGGLYQAQALIDGSLSVRTAIQGAHHENSSL